MKVGGWRDKREIRGRRIQTGADGCFEARLTDVATACAFAFLCGALLDSAIRRCAVSANTSA